MTYIIKVIEKATGEVVKAIESDKEREAHRVFNAMVHQTNHDDFAVLFEEVGV
jgi:uncharacterized FlaG/YvyC family protein